MSNPTSPDKSGGGLTRAEKPVELRYCKHHGWIDDRWWAFTEFGADFHYCALCHPGETGEITEDIEFQHIRTFYPESLLLSLAEECERRAARDAKVKAHEMAARAYREIAADIRRRLG